MNKPEKETSHSRQTRGFLMDLLKSNGLSPRKQFGQNFLIDMNLLDTFVQTAKIDPKDVILEVGAGTGGLTTRIAEKAARVISVEIDSGLFRLVQVAVMAYPNVTLIHGDALESKHTVSKQVIDALTHAMAENGVNEYSLVANLPYDIAAPLIMNLILEKPTVRNMTTTIQLEMGQKIIAEPGSEDYGPLAILVRAVGSAEILRVLPASAFWPRPNVESAFVRIEVASVPRIPRQDWTNFHEFVRDLFLYRRKSVRAALGKIDRLALVADQRDAILSNLNMDANTRAEQMDVDALYRLFVEVRKCSNSELH